MCKLTVILALIAVATALPTASIQKQNAAVNLEENSRIISNSDAAAGAYPYMVSLRSSANSHYCSGTILNNRWILTAAHCIVGQSTGNVHIVAGTYTLVSGGVVCGSSRLVIHTNYNTATLANDVSVIELATSLVYSNNINQIALGTSNVGAVAAIIIGWDRTASNPNNLQQITTNTMTHAQCQSILGSLVSTSQICAFSNTGNGACNMDSGGPLIQANSGQQIGVASFALPCAQGLPDVFARVASYVSWIVSAVSS